MERTVRLARCIVCAVLTTAVIISGTDVAAASAHKRPRTCVVSVKRLTNKPGRRLRRVVRCTNRKARRRATIALKVRGARPKSAQKAAPKQRAATASASAAAVSGGLDVGLNTDVSGWGDHKTQRMTQIESQTSAKWMREAFTWSQIEPQNGTYDFSNYDDLMTIAAQNGVHILANLLGAPSWAAATWNTIPNDPTAYASFVATVVGRYGPHGSFWNTHPTLTKDPITTYELLNEPYYDNGDNGDYNPGRYARLVKAAGAAGHATDPSAQFLLAAENQSQLVGSTWVWWTDALYQAVPDLNTYYDGIAVHPYGTDLTNLQSITPGVTYSGYDQVRRLESIHQQFTDHNAPNKPLWITEIGWPTCTNGGSDRCTTPTGQAANIQTVFNDARGGWKPYVQAVFLYGYQDNDPNSADPENDYGLVHNDGSPKPALSVFKANL